MCSKYFCLRETVTHLTSTTIIKSQTEWTFQSSKNKSSKSQASSEIQLSINSFIQVYTTSLFIPFLNICY